MIDPALTDPARVGGAVATALGLPVPSGEVTESLQAQLQGKAVLLVLDCCEHLIGAVARLANDVLHANPSLRIVATSREPLRISGEAVWRLPPLSVPGAGVISARAALGFTAVQLFVQRASAAAGDFEFTDEHAGAVADICRHLDGLPLTGKARSGDPPGYRRRPPRGPGGAHDMTGRPPLTHANGAPVADNLNILTAGARGPALLQDIWLLEKLAHFDREVIPERRMHAKASGAYGTFTVTQDITRYTKADLFAEVGRQTPVFVRFSTVVGERGAADAERDIRGFAVKFYTRQGNWDLVGNNTPVFFFRDPLRFPDLNHAVKRDPRTGMRSANNNWDFWTLLPEALHQVTIVMSDRGLPRSYRHMHGFGSHTFSLVDQAGARVWVKFHLRCQQPISNLTDAEAEAVVGKDRESHQRDLFEAIEACEFPRWTLCIQVMTEEAARRHQHNPFDVTKVWPKAHFPLVEVGVLELNRNPENVFAEVEQAAFSPANVVPGIGFSPDRMLQARLFSYGDAQRYRVGVNFNQIPVNAPKCPFHSYHRDGTMRTDGNLGATPTYFPNSRGEWSDAGRRDQPPLDLDGPAAHWDHRVEDDHFQQPGDLFRQMTAEQREALFANTARSLAGADLEIQRRHVDNCRRADPAYGAGLAAALGIVAPEPAS